MKVIIEETIDVFVDGELAGYMTERRENYGVCEITQEEDQWRNWKHNGRQVMVYLSFDHQRVSLPYRHRTWEQELNCVLVASDGRDFSTEMCEVCAQVHESLNCPPREPFHATLPLIGSELREVYLKLRRQPTNDIT